MLSLAASAKLLCFTAFAAGSAAAWAQAAEPADTSIEPPASNSQSQSDESNRACFHSLTITPAAVDSCQVALATQPAGYIRARLHSALALQWVRRGQDVRANEELQAALEMYPHDAVVQGNLGSIQLLNGNFNDAITAYNAALQLPLDVAAEATIYLNRALALRGLGRYAEAREDYQLYLDIGGSRRRQASELMFTQ